MHFRDSPNFASVPKLRRHPLPTLISTFSLSSFIVPLRPCLPVLPIHVHIALLCFCSHFRYSHSRFFPTSDILINAMIPDSIYKTCFHVIIRHVRISTWTLIPLIVCLTSLITTRLPISGNLPEITIVNTTQEVFQALLLTSTLTYLDYAQFQITSELPDLFRPTRNHSELSERTRNTRTRVVGSKVQRMS